MESDEEENFTFPDKSELKESLGQERMTEKMYSDLGTLVEIINQQEVPISLEHLFYKAKAGDDYSIDGDPDDSPTDPDKNRLAKLYQWDLEISKWVVGNFPPSPLWVELALREIGSSSVTEVNLNEVQKTCAQLGEREREAYFQASGREFQAKMFDSIKNPVDEADTVGRFVDIVVDNLLELAAKELPERATSINQGALSLAGSANEEIAVQSLQSADLVRGSESDSGDFTKRTEDADLIVFGPNDSEMNVEIKSTAVRERASRAMMGEGNGWALFGFFEDSNEVRRGILYGNEQGSPWRKSTSVVYAPPEIVAEVRSLDESKDDGKSAYTIQNEDGNLLLRANNVFPADMKRFTEDAELTDVDVGHEASYISSD